MKLKTVFIISFFLSATTLSAEVKLSAGMVENRGELEFAVLHKINFPFAYAVGSRSHYSRNYPLLRFELQGSDEIYRYGLKAESTAWKRPSKYGKSSHLGWHDTLSEHHDKINMTTFKFQDTTESFAGLTPYFFKKARTVNEDNRYEVYLHKKVNPYFTVGVAGEHEHYLNEVYDESGIHRAYPFVDPEWFLGRSVSFKYTQVGVSVPFIFNAKASDELTFTLMLTPALTRMEAQETIINQISHHNTTELVLGGITGKMEFTAAYALTDSLRLTFIVATRRNYKSLTQKNLAWYWLSGEMGDRTFSVNIKEGTAGLQCEFLF